MEEDFNKRLSDHIKTVFDDTDNTGADAGWLLLREKYPPKNDRKPIAWFWWLAALMVVAGLAGLWQVEKNEQNKAIKIVVKPHNDSAGQHKLTRPVSKSSNIKNTLPAGKSSVTPATKIHPEIVNREPMRQIPAKSHQRKQNNTTFKLRPIKQPVITANTLTVNNEVNPSSQSGLQPGESTKKPAGDSKMNSHLNSAAADSIPPPVAEIKADTTLPGITKKSAVVKPLKTDTTKNKASTSKKRLTWGVFASAFYSTATGSDNEFNWGGGGTVNVLLHRHFSFSSGLGLMRSTLNYSGNPFSSGNLFSSLPVAQTQFLYLHNYAVRLWTIDIPVNLKYSFAKPYNFVSAGVSSNVYISEYYNQGYTYSPAPSGLADVHQVTQRHFDHADLLKTINLSFGLGYPVSSKSVLIFEPFLKMSLSGLGSQKLKYTLAGANINLSF